MNKKGNKSLVGRELPLNERLFRMILLVGAFADSVALVETLILVGMNSFIIPLSVLLVAILVAMILSIKFHFNTVASYIIDIILVFFVFPEMFFLNGGAQGGASVWFVISIVYTFLMFSGKQLVLFVTIDVVVDLVVYWIAYTKPGMVTPLDSQLDIYIDSLFSVLIVGLAIGAMLKFQINGYIYERGLVERQKNELEDAGRSKDVFFASMSNELKTPINSIMGMDELIRRECNNETIYGYTRGIHQASTMLLNLINEILDYSQMESDNLEIKDEQYSSAQMLENVIITTQLLVREENEKIDFEFYVDDSIPEILIGDMRRMEQICMNVLSNAVKYTNEGKVKLDISMTMLDEENIELNIQVSDTGIGIKNVENLTGTGFGLAITKRLVELMGGTLSIDSSYNKGTILSITVRQGYIMENTIGKINAILHNYQHLTREYKPRFVASKAKILIVSNNKMDIHVIRELLHSTKIQIQIAYSGDECLSMALRHHYNVILIDYNMEHFNGVETIKSLHKQKNGLCKDSAVIAMTSSLNKKNEAYFQQAGFNGYLEKPIDSNLLEDYIYSFLPEDTVEYQSFHMYSDIAMPPRNKIERHKKRVVITTDCVSEIPEYVAERFDIGIIYMYVDTPKGRFEDIREIEAESLISYMDDKESRVKTESASISEYENFFAKHLESAEHVIHISMAQNMGESNEVAQAAAKSFDHIHVIDSKQISCGQSMVVFCAARLANAGKSVEEICRAIEIISEHIETSFVMPTASIFYQKGYTNIFIEKSCRYMKMKPVFVMKNSRLTPKGVVMGNMENARKNFVKMHLKKKKHIDRKIVVLSHVGIKQDEMKTIKTEINDYLEFSNVRVQRTSCSCACNAGIGSFGFAYFINSAKMKDELREDEFEIIMDF